MIRNHITESLKQAMIAKDEKATSAIRMINAAIKQKDIDVARPKGLERISDDDVLALLQNMIKSRRESIALYKQGGRQELADKEQAEITIIEKFLPAQMDDAQIAAAIKSIIASTGAAGIKDMGKVMAVLKTDYAGKMDMGKAGAAVKTALSG